MTPSKLARLLLAAFVVAGIAGCDSDAGKAFNDDGSPASDTGPVAQETTGGDAAGSFNWKPVKEGSQHGEHAVEKGPGETSSRH